eukprot:3271513-Amphidinium_carterae.1
MLRKHCSKEVQHVLDVSRKLRNDRLLLTFVPFQAVRLLAQGERDAQGAAMGVDALQRTRTKARDFATACQFVRFFRARFGSEFFCVIQKRSLVTVVLILPNENEDDSARVAEIYS